MNDTTAEGPRIREMPAPQDLVLCDLLAYWRSKCGPDGRLPGRAAIDPADLPQLLPHLFLIDVEGGEEAAPAYRVRLLGTAQSVIYNGSYTGQTIEQMMGSKATLFRHAFDQARHRRGPVGYAGKLIWWFGKEWIEFESIQMPLAGDGNAIDMIIGAGVFSIMGRKWG